MEIGKKAGRIHVLLGYSGSGKSTITKWILNLRQRYIHISTSDIVHELGGHDDEAIKEGQLYSDEERLRKALTFKIDEILTNHKDAHIILDGCPRTIEQYEWLVKNYSIDLGVFIYLHTSEELLRKRCSDRKREDIQDYDSDTIVNKRLAREMAEYPPIWKEIIPEQDFYMVNNDLLLEVVVSMVINILDGDISTLV